MEDYAKMIPISKEAKETLKQYKYDKCLKIVIHGEPITASHRSTHGQVINVNLGKLKMRFKPLYNSSELLQNTMIHSIYHIDYKFYMHVTKKDMARIKKNPSELKKLKRDRLEDLSIKDIDNMQKVHGDLIFTREFRLTIDDAYNVGYLRPEKFASLNPRAEIYIYYKNKMDPWHKYKILGSALYFEHMICYKRMKILKRTPKQQMTYLKKYVCTDLERYKKLPDKIKVIKRLSCVLEEYPADILKEMGNLSVEFRKYNKYDAVLKLLLVILSKHKDIISTLTGLKK